MKLWPVRALRSGVAVRSSPARRRYAVDTVRHRHFPPTALLLTALAHSRAPCGDVINDAHRPAQKLQVSEPFFRVANARTWQRQWCAIRREFMKGRVLLLGIGMLTACTSVTGVNSRQDGHLSVTSRARWDFVSWNHVRSASLKEAQAYCHKRKKEMHAIQVHSEGLRGVTSQTVEVIFDCI
ncbi:hypothetical protein [Paraburkholderia tropica]|nr:hypothetical protein [Paraburkholderia tropica]